MSALTQRIFFLACGLVAFGSASAQQLGIFDGQQDIGTVAKPGTGTYAAATQQYTVAGGGANVWADHDDFHFVYKKLTGDFILYARAELVGQGAEPHRKMGWMVRQSLASNSPQVCVAVHGDGLTSLQYRRAAGAATAETKAAIAHADVVQLERVGQTFTMRVAQFGQPFVTAQVANLDLGADVYAGLFVCAHAAAGLEQATFRDVRLAVPAPASLVPYRQYLGSHLEVLEPATGRREIIYTSPVSIQAPNWRPDGKSLIYNSDGLMYNFDLATRQPALLPTGEVKNNNNDHVLSFDGKQLGLSSGVEALGGSIGYTVAAAGGQPRQLTPRGPSYLHGWSPDAKFLIFTGERRNQNFDIYRVPAAGGPEVRLTTDAGLDDGPEYTPDGQYIYFNSNRTGTMQVWRMRADGSQPQPITHGDYQDWFPHVSPDGKWLVFVSFLKEEVAAGDHPFYKHVYLRLLPVGSTGEPKVIAYLYGGQGTINTPSWSPDSKRLAFISNSAEVR